LKALFDDPLAGVDVQRGEDVVQEQDLGQGVDCAGERYSRFLAATAEFAESLLGGDGTTGGKFANTP
jgi:hypothetical protein